MKTSLLLVVHLLAGLGFAARAQVKQGPALSKTSLGIHAGSQGFGLNAARALSHTFSLRLSGSYAPYNFSRVRTWNGNDYDLRMKSEFSNLLLQAEYRPFNEAGESGFASKLAVTVGGAFFFQSEANAKGVPTNDYTLGDLIIDREEIGTINVKSEWKSVAPYAGLGLREIKLGRNLSLNADLGSHYLSAPKVSLTGDKLLSGNEANQEILENNLKNYRWLPVLQLGLSCHF